MMKLRSIQSHSMSNLFAALLQVSWLPFIRRYGKYASRLVTFINDHWPPLMFYLFMLTIIAISWDLYLHWHQPTNLDWFWLTGYPVGLYVLIRGGGLQGRIFALRHSLIEQGILEIYKPGDPPPTVTRERPGFTDATSEEILLIRRGLQARVLDHTATAAIIIAVMTLVAVSVNGISKFSLNPYYYYYSFLVSSCYLLLIGLIFGRMLAFSLLIWLHRYIPLHANSGNSNEEYRVRLNPQPGHPDNACGLKIISDFWVYEASLLIPFLIYFLFWLFVMVHPEYQSNLLWDLTFGADSIYKNTVTVLIGFTMFLLLLQVFSLWVPLFALRYEMGKVKDNVKKYLDKYAIASGQLKYEIIACDDKDERAKKVDELTHTVDAYRDYENIPLWPVSFKTIARYFIQLWTVLVFIGIVSTDNKPWFTINCLLEKGDIKTCYQKSVRP